MIRKLVPTSTVLPKPKAMTEAEFRWEHNQDPMAVENWRTASASSPSTSANLKIFSPPNFNLATE